MGYIVLQQCYLGIKLTREQSPFGENITVGLVYNLTTLDSIASLQSINHLLSLFFKYDLIKMETSRTVILSPMASTL